MVVDPLALPPNVIGGDLEEVAERILAARGSEVAARWMCPPVSDRLAI
jgi:hypothetical protein